MVNGHIDYLKPVVGNIIAAGHVDASDMNRFLSELQDNGRSKLEAYAQVERDAKIAVRFTASLHARLD